MTRSARPDDGFTLLEILVAVALLAVAVTAIVSGMMTTILASDVHRKQATGESVSRGYAESVKTALTAAYVPCATTAVYQAVPVTFNPNFYTVAIEEVAYQSGGTWSTTPPVTCLTSNPAQRVRLSIKATDDRADERVEIVVRKGN